jgi:hypothetical protein
LFGALTAPYDGGSLRTRSSGTDDPGGFRRYPDGDGDEVCLWLRSEVLERAEDDRCREVILVFAFHHIVFRFLALNPELSTAAETSTSPSTAPILGPGGPSRRTVTRMYNGMLESGEPYAGDFNRFARYFVKRPSEPASREFVASQS